VLFKTALLWRGQTGLRRLDGRDDCELGAIGHSDNCELSRIAVGRRGDDCELSRIAVGRHSVLLATDAQLDAQLVGNKT
jgi:hypothetical protein